MQDNRGNSTPLDVDLSVQSYGLAVVKTTRLSLLGGKYGWSFVAPVLSMKLDLGIPTPAGRLSQSGRNTALGDLQVSPITVSWMPAQNLFVNASLMLQLPTGSYDRNRLVNAGMNHWVVSPTVAFTYITSFGGELSSNIQLNVNGRNRDTDYRSGIEYQHEFAIGQHIGPWTVGIGATTASSSPTTPRPARPSKATAHACSPSARRYISSSLAAPGRSSRCMPTRSSPRATGRRGGRLRCGRRGFSRAASNTPGSRGPIASCRTQCTDATKGSCPRRAHKHVFLDKMHCVMP